MTGRLLVLTPFLFMLTSCQQEQLSLPVTHAASTQEARFDVFLHADGKTPGESPAPAENNPATR